MGSDREPVTFATCGQVTGPFFHGTNAVLPAGAELVAGRVSNFRADRVMRHIYFTTLVGTAAWGAQLASALAGEPGPGHIYEVEPLGAFEDDPNVTDKKFPGNPTLSFRSREPLRVLGEVEGWVGHPPERLAEMLAGLQRLREQGLDVIED